MTPRINKERYKRAWIWIPEADIFELDNLAILWGMNRALLIRIAVKKFIRDPSIDFELDAKEPDRTLRVVKKKHG